ncbi:MAG: carbohydrate kinase [Archangium gephyra]|uniref:Carbohydrate kinase n=1 Tax=Archangium gephyra TaxID=48 RepID=A0A2W5UWF0_9BACT|nr:MAG: carbohydrate kinase [Archangium gephyra]
MLDVVSLGEALVDFLPERRGARVREVAQWTPCIGGAPANVTVGLSRLGAKSALVGVTGDDEFGHFLKERLEGEGVDVRFLRQTKDGKTGLAFVSLTRSGDRSFTFYRTRSAETFLCETEASRVPESKVLHVGTNSLIHAAARAAVQGAVKRAYDADRIVSTDPNLRLHLWKDPRVLQALLNKLFVRCSVVKLSEEEIEFACGTAKIEKALDALEARGVVVSMVTLGARGAALRFHGQTRYVPAKKVKVVDTTGAGDGFTAGFLFGLTRHYGSRTELEAADIDTLEGHARFACLVGSHAVTRLGAVAGLPTLRTLRKK